MGDGRPAKQSHMTGTRSRCPDHQHLSGEIRGLLCCRIAASRICCKGQQMRAGKQKFMEAGTPSETHGPSSGTWKPQEVLTVHGLGPPSSPTATAASPKFSRAVESPACFFGVTGRRG